MSSEVFSDVENVGYIPPKRSGPFEIVTGPELMREWQAVASADRSAPPEPSSDEDDSDDSVILLKVVRLSQGVIVDRTPRKIKQEIKQEESTPPVVAATRLFERSHDENKPCRKRAACKISTPPSNNDHAPESPSLATATRVIERSYNENKPRRKQTAYKIAAPRYYNDHTPQTKNGTRDGRFRPSHSSAAPRRRLLDNTAYTRKKKRTASRVASAKDDDDFISYSPETQEPADDLSDVASSLESIKDASHADDLSDVASVLESLKDASHEASKKASKDDKNDYENFSDLEVQFTPKKKKRRGRPKNDDDEEFQDFSPGFEGAAIDPSHVRTTRRKAIPTQRYQPIEKVPGTVRIPQRLRTNSKAIYKETSSEHDSEEESSESDDCSFGAKDASESPSLGTIEEQDSKQESSFREEDFSDAESSLGSTIGDDS